MVKTKLVDSEIECTELPIDPTANVMFVIEAAVNRLDDLRIASDLRMNDLRAAETHHVSEIADLRERHAKELRCAEAERIDAIRSVDVGNVQRAAEVQQQQAVTLATQVAVSAETLRTQVQATATAGTRALTAALEPMQKSIDDLRRAQYEAQGQKTQIVETQSEVSTGGQKTGLYVAISVAIFTTIFGFIGIVVAVIEMINK